MDDDETTVIGHEDEADRTIAVSRRPRAARPAHDEDDEDRTVVVDRDDDADADENTDPDPTIAVGRKRRGAPDPVITLLPARRGIPAPPVDPATAREPVTPVGANAVESYAARAIAPAPLVPPAVPRGAPAREGMPSLPSVARSSRRWGSAALFAFAVACVVSVVGVVALVVWFVRG